MIQQRNRYAIKMRSQSKGVSVGGNSPVQSGYGQSVDREEYEAPNPVLSSQDIYPQNSDLDPAGDDTLNRLPPQMRPFIKRWKQMAP